MFIKTYIFAGLCAVGSMLATPLMAQTTDSGTGTTVEINPLTVEGLVVGKRMAFGAEFAATYNIAVPIPFSFTIPTDRNRNIRVEPAPGGSGIYKVNFATLDNQLKSSLQFVPIKIPMGDDAARKELLADVAKRAFVASVVDPEQAELAAIRVTKIGPYLAIEALGKYADTDGTVVALRTVAIVGPDSEHGLVGIVNALPKNAGMTKVADILLVDGSRALGTLRFE